ncbi:MAG: hypothetical protein GY947_05285 [Rhodobacteraceae bacterium]|nr:hypothetical protein [Paracoccaceae bacterium]
MKDRLHIQSAGHKGSVTDIYHHMVCRHRVEVEVWPARVELNFGDERWANPITSQMRFEATAYNTDRGVNWSVRDPAGNPGAGSIDQSGLYKAPPKGGLASGLTDIVVVSAKEDPLRKAFAWVTLLGSGPAPAPEPQVEVLPKVAHLYYPNGHHNAYIDDSNKMQIFRASIRDSAQTDLRWLVNGVPDPAGTTAPWFQYKATSGSPQMMTIRVEIKNLMPVVFDEAKIIQLNYDWPGL